MFNRLKSFFSAPERKTLQTARLNADAFVNTKSIN